MENQVFKNQLSFLLQRKLKAPKHPFYGLLWGLRPKLMIPSSFPWKVVTFLGTDHINWSIISGVMIG